MHYEIAFDNLNIAYTTWSSVAFSSILLAVTTGLCFLVKRRKTLPFWGWSESPLASQVFAFVCLGVAVLWVTGEFVGNYLHYITLKNARQRGQAHVVEGVVSNFQPKLVAGHGKERFCVSNTCFEYSDYEFNYGFNSTVWGGGPIREGLPVRVTYVGNTIVKLEVGQSS